MNKRIFVGAGLAFICLSTFAVSPEVQSQLMDIASQEAAIANIGANKVAMLYGTNSPIPTINRWNSVAHRPALTEEQIEQINALEAQKQDLIKPKACQ